MRRLEQSKKFNGINVILSEDEFNKWVSQIDNVIDAFKNDKEELLYVDKLKSLRTVLTNFAYFDVDDREVHCRFGYYEFELMIECITLALPKIKENNGEFAKLITNPETKLWKN